MAEGADAYKRFEDGLKKVLSVPRPVFEKRSKVYQEAAASNPNRRGPKRKESAD